jgi:hypothetical protein
MSHKGFLIFVLLLVFPSSVFSKTLTKSSEIQVVSEVTSQEYFSVLAHTFQNAKKSIWIVLESLSISEEENDPILKVIQTLLLSAIEGVQVRILLNPSIGSTPVTLPNLNPLSKDVALSLLQSAKIPLQWTSPEKTFPTNLVIVDEHIVIEGRQPWISKLDWSRHHYSNTCIVSKTFAHKKIQTLQNFGFFKSSLSSDKETKIDKNLFYPLPNYFMQDSSVWMQDKDSQRALDLFLWLSQNSAFRTGYSVNYSIPVLAKALLPEIQNEKQRKKPLLRWIKILSQLKLLQKQKGEDKDFLALQMSPHDPHFFFFPLHFMDYGLGERLRFSEKLTYLVGSDFASQKPEIFVFFTDKAFYSRLTPWTENAVNGFLDTLEKHRLIQWQESFPLGENGPWMASYAILPPMDPMFIDKQCLLLDQQHGQDSRKKAQFLASQLNQELNPNIISEILIRIQNHGFLETQKAFHAVMRLPRNHPWKNFERVKLLLSQAPIKQKSKNQ